MPRFFIFLILMMSPLILAAAEEGHHEHHPHHIAIAGGIAGLDAKTSAYVGADYVYSWENNWGLGVFYEEVIGDFDLQAIGLLVTRKFDSGWKFNFGPGVERKIKKDKDKKLFLFRLQTGYDWHSGHWSWGPQLTLDLIEDGHTTWYLGFSVGYGW